MTTYFRPTGPSTARSTALSSWGSGILLTTWPGPSIYEFDGSALSSLPLSMPTQSLGFTAVTNDPAGNAWILGYFGGVAKVAPDGTATTYQLTTGLACFTGAAFRQGQPYFLQSTGSLYTIANGLVVPVSGGFGEEALSLSTDGTRLYAALPNSQNLGVFTFASFVSGAATRVTTPMAMPSSTAAGVSGVAVAGRSNAALVSGAVSLEAWGDVYAVAANTSSNAIMLLSGPDPNWQLISTVSGRGAPVDVAWASVGEQVIVTDTANALVSIYNLANNALAYSNTSIATTGANQVAVTPDGLVALVTRTTANSIRVFTNASNTWTTRADVSVVGSPGVIAMVSNAEAVAGYVPAAGGGGLVWLNMVNGNWQIEAQVTGLPFAVSGIALDLAGTVYAVGTAGSTGYLWAVTKTGVKGQTSWTGRGDAVYWEQGQIAVLDSNSGGNVPSITLAASAVFGTPRASATISTVASSGTFGAARASATLSATASASVTAVFGTLRASATLTGKSSASVTAVFGTPRASATLSKTTSASAAAAFGAPSASAALSTGPMARFTVSVNGGFVDPTGQPFNMRGLNALVIDASTGFGHVMLQYPALTTIRLNCNSATDSAASIDAVVQQYTGIGVVVILEDHSGNENNVAWYQQMAQAYKGNPRVFLETPNEPQSASTVQNQIGIINAIKAAGFTGPIGLQPLGGSNFAGNIAAVIAAVGTAQIFVTPHIYSTDTNPTNVASAATNAIYTAGTFGLFPAIDEFGNAANGYTLDPYGNLVISSVIAANQTGQAGAVFWAMDNGNHTDGADSAFLTPDGSQLTVTGIALQPWLSEHLSWNDVQQVHAGGAQSVTFPVAVGSGNAVVGGVTWDTSAGATLTSITDDKGNSYTILDSLTNWDDGQSAASFIRGNITNAPTIIYANFSVGPSSLILVANEYHGALATTNPTDVHSAQIQLAVSTATSAVTSPAATTTLNGDLIFGLTFNTHDGTIPSVGVAGTVGFFTGDGASYGGTGPDFCSEYQTQQAAGSIAAAFTSATSSNYITFLITIKPAGYTG